MIEMILHEVYVLQYSHQAHQTLFVVLKAKELNRYLPMHFAFNYARKLVEQLRGESWGQAFCLPKGTEDEAYVECFEFKRCGESFNIFMKFREGKMDERDRGIQNEKTGAVGIAQALKYNLPIYMNQDLLDEFGVDEPTDFNQTLKSVELLDRSKRED